MQRSMFSGMPRPNVGCRRCRPPCDKSTNIYGRRPRPVFGEPLNQTQPIPAPTVENGPTSIEEAAAGLSPNEQAEAKRYGRISLALTLADMALDLVFLALAAFVLARPIDAWLASYQSPAWPQSYVRLLALFLAVNGTPHAGLTAAVVLFRLRGGAPVRPQQSIAATLVPQLDAQQLAGDGVGRRL